MGINKLDLNYFQSYYQNKRVFLTGHTGFKGAWMLAWLSKWNAEVKGFALDPIHEKDLYNIINGDKLCNSVIGDIRNQDLLNKEIQDFQPDYIFHFAAQPLVRDSYLNPVATFETNAIGTANLLESLRHLQKPCSVVLITTDKVYENLEWVFPYRENDRLGGYDPYSSSKACAELIISSYRNSFFNKDTINEHGKGLAVARAGNVIGGGDWSKDRIIPDIVSAIINNRPISVRNPNSIRPWQHVLEPLSGYLILGAKLSENPSAFSEAFNFGPQANDVLPVLELVKKAIDIFGKGTFTITDQVGQPHEAGVLKLDISKAMNSLNWFPKFTVDIAIAKTINWYKNYTEGYNSTFEEISDFINEK